MSHTREHLMQELDRLRDKKPHAVVGISPEEPSRGRENIAVLIELAIRELVALFKQADDETTRLREENARLHAQMAHFNAYLQAENARIAAENQQLAAECARLRAMK